MRLRTFALFLWCFLIGSAAIASEERRTEIRIAVDGDENGLSEFRFDSADAGIDIHELEVGETKTYTDNDGNEVRVTRNEDGFEFDVAGETIVIADAAHGDHDLTMRHVGNDGNVLIEKHRKVHVVQSDDESGVTIISGDEIDADTRARIEQVLIDAGKDGEVVFIDGSELSGDERADRQRGVRIIRKEIDVTNQ